ncbi:MAG: hypothetical protein ACD_60C00004G0012 [uncultured bacterium]|nr:MAG: hypothetical protein ACD_60C00004G0012 [uncultured bacterium]
MSQPRQELNPYESYDHGRNSDVIAKQAALAEELLKQGKNLTSKELAFIGITFNEQGNFDPASECLKNALKKLEEEKLDPQEKLYIRTAVQCAQANIKREHKEIDQSIVEFTAAKNECDKITDLSSRSRVAYDIQRNLGIAYLIKQNYPLAIEAFERGRTAARDYEKLTDVRGRLPIMYDYCGLAKVRASEMMGPLEFTLHQGGMQGLEMAKEKLYQEGICDLEMAGDLFARDPLRKRSQDHSSWLFHMGLAYKIGKNYPAAIASIEAGLALRKELISFDKEPMLYCSRVGDAHKQLQELYLKVDNQAKESEHAGEYDRLRQRLEVLQKAPAQRNTEEKIEVPPPPPVVPGTRARQVMFIVPPRTSIQGVPPQTPLNSPTRRLGGNGST